MIDEQPAAESNQLDNGKVNSNKIPKFQRFYAKSFILSFLQMFGCLLGIQQELDQQCTMYMYMK